MKNLGLIFGAIMALMSTHVCAQQVVNISIGDFQVTESSEFTNELKVKLQATRKFIVTDYADLAESLRNNGQNPESFVKRQHSESDLLDESTVDYLLKGAVQENVKGASKVSIELIKIARDGTPQIDTNGVLIAPLESSSNIAQNELAVEKVRDMVVASLFPVRVVSTITENNELMLNYGEGLLSVGDLLEVQSDAASLEAQSTPVKLEVTRVGKKFSFARVVEGNSELKAGMVLRANGSKATVVQMF